MSGMYTSSSLAERSKTGEINDEFLFPDDRQMFLNIFCAQKHTFWLTPQPIVDFPDTIYFRRWIYDRYHRVYEKYK